MWWTGAFSSSVMLFSRNMFSDRRRRGRRTGETDHDTGGDGKADLVKAFLQIPRSAAEGKYKAAAPP